MPQITEINMVRDSVIDWCFTCGDREGKFQVTVREDEEGVVVRGVVCKECVKEGAGFLFRRLFYGKEA